MEKMCMDLQHQLCSELESGRDGEETLYSRQMAEGKGGQRNQLCVARWRVFYRMVYTIFSST